MGPQGEDSATAVVISDLAWVMDENRNILVFGASTSNDLVLVDLDDVDFRMAKLPLTTTENEANGGSERQIEWAQGTDYVWINARDNDELYVVEVPTEKIDDARVVKTISSHDQGDLIFVENFERRAVVQLMKALTTQALADYEPPMTDDESVMASTSGDDGTTVAAGLKTNANNEDGSDALSVAALVLSILAMLLGMFAVFKANSATIAAKTDVVDRLDREVSSTNDSITKGVGEDEHAYVA